MAEIVGNLFDFIDIFEHSKLFEGIPPADYQSSLAECAIIKTVCGQTLIEKGSENRSTYLVLSGLLTIHLEDKSNPPIRTVIMGETVGELSLLGGTHAIAYVVVQEVGFLLEIPREVMWELIRKSAHLAQNLLFILTDWIISDNERFIDRTREVEDLRNLSQLDGLTGLANRRALDKFLQRIFIRSQMSGKPFSVLMMDVDRFKLYNDRHGHQGGDQALIAFAEVLKEAVRPMDFASRYGGEEFTVVLPDSAREDAAIVAERLRIAVENKLIVAKDGSPLSSVTVSLGIADSYAMDSVEEILALADARLYQAKQEGRNRCCW